MKPPDSWDETDLIQMVKEKREESLQLEFKRADSLQNTDKNKTEISKDISSFANSAGGVLLYGIQESSKKPHAAEALSPVDPATCSKEWLEQVINSRIQPRIHGLLIHPIELQKTEPGKYVYAMVIPESYTAHQASDKKYYKRFNFESVPMEDYEVRQTMNRGERPAYELRLQAVQRSDHGGMTNFRFAAMLQNISEIVGRDVSAVLFAPKQLVNQPDEYCKHLDSIPYTKIAGTYTESSHSIKSVINSVGPLTQYAFEFPKSMAFGNNPPEAPRFTVMICVFDQFGIALRASFHVYMQNLEIQQITEELAAKRMGAEFFAEALK